MHVRYALHVQVLENAGPAAFTPAPEFGADPMPRAPAPNTTNADDGVTSSAVPSDTRPTNTSTRDGALQEAAPFVPLDDSEAREGFGAGKAAGLVIGLLIPIILLAILAWYCIRARRKRQGQFHQVCCMCTTRNCSTEIRGYISLHSCLIKRFPSFKALNM